MSHKYFWFIFLTVVILSGSSFCFVKSKDNVEQVILLVINQLSFTDEKIYRTIPGFENLEKYAAKGAMNINSAGNRTDFNSYLSIGGGSRGVGLDGEMGKSYMVNETVKKTNILSGDIYKTQTGINLIDNNTIIFLPIENLKKTNIQKFSFKVGGLGEALIEEGRTHKVYGNNDTDSEIIRYAPLITMNQLGISYGDVSNKTLIQDKSRPYGIKTNYSYLLDMWEKSENEDISLVVFDLGDLYRLGQFSENMSDEHEVYIRKEILNEIGEFIEYFSVNLKNNQRLIVISPMVNSEAIKEKKLLSPIWVYSKENNGDILTSNTTKREGIVANIDIAQTILSLLNISKDPSMVGEIIKVKKSEINFQSELNHIYKIYELRPTVLYNYVMLQIIILIVATVYWLRNREVNSCWVRIGLISILFIPCMLLLTAFITPENPYSYLLEILLGSLIIGWLLHKLNPSVSFLLIGGITFLLITIDIILGEPLMKRSFLGYDPIIGARYYGIGNEYMGVYIGSTMLFVGSLLQIRKNKFTLTITLIIFAVLILLLSYPTLGTNAGGTIAAIFAVGTTSYKILNLDWGRKSLYLFTTMLLLLITTLIIFNFFIPTENQSHIGKAINQLFQGDFASILQTIRRKLETNWKLIQVSLWGKVMITSLLSLGILFIWPKYNIRILGEYYQNIYYAFYGIIMGAFVALIVNDSGIVASASMIIYLITPLLYVSLLEKTELKG